MPKSSVTGFPATEQGAGFFRAYDTVLSNWPGEVTSEQVQSSFGTTWVNMCGPVDAPPVILVPGQRATSTVWFNNVGELSRRHRVFAIDIIGDAGRSVAAADTPVRSRDDLLAWFSGIIDHFTLDAPAVVAHSYGAMIALAYALAHPERVSKLVLLDPNSTFTGMRVPYLLHAVPLPVRPTGKRERKLHRLGDRRPAARRGLARPHHAGSGELPQRENGHSQTPQGHGAVGTDCTDCTDCTNHRHSGRTQQSARQPPHRRKDPHDDAGSDHDHPARRNPPQAPDEPRPSTEHRTRHRPRLIAVGGGRHPGIWPVTPQLRTGHRDAATAGFFADGADCYGSHDCARKGSLGPRGGRWEVRAYSDLRGLMSDQAPRCPSAC